MIEAAAFGKEVEYFLEGNIGSYLVKIAKQRSEQATEALKSVDPTNTAQIIALQMKAQVSDSIIEWLGEVIAQGYQAQTSLGIRQSEDE